MRKGFFNPSPSASRTHNKPITNRPTHTSSSAAPKTTQVVEVPTPTQPINTPSATSSHSTPSPPPQIFVRWSLLSSPTDNPPPSRLVDLLSPDQRSDLAKDLQSFLSKTLRNNDIKATAVRINSSHTSMRVKPLNAADFHRLLSLNLHPPTTPLSASLPSRFTHARLSFEEAGAGRHTVLFELAPDLSEPLQDAAIAKAQSLLSPLALSDHAMTLRRVQHAPNQVIISFVASRSPPPSAYPQDMGVWLSSITAAVGSDAVLRISPDWEKSAGSSLSLFEKRQLIRDASRNSFPRSSPHTHIPTSSNPSPCCSTSCEARFAALEHKYEMLVARLEKLSLCSSPSSSPSPAKPSSSAPAKPSSSAPAKPSSSASAKPSSSVPAYKPYPELPEPSPAQLAASFDRMFELLRRSHLPRDQETPIEVSAPSGSTSFTKLKARARSPTTDPTLTAPATKKQR